MMIAKLGQKRMQFWEFSRRKMQILLMLILNIKEKLLNSRKRQSQERKRGNFTLFNIGSNVSLLDVSISSRRQLRREISEDGY